MAEERGWCLDEIWQIYFDCVCTRCREVAGKRLEFDRNPRRSILRLLLEAAAFVAAAVALHGRSAGSLSCRMLVTCVSWT